MAISASAAVAYYKDAVTRAHALLDAWLAYKDADDLYPECLGVIATPAVNMWSVDNAGADLYSSFVLIEAYLNRSALSGTLTDTLTAETALTSRVGVLPDDWNLTTEDWRYGSVDYDRILFTSAEWMRDGLLRVSEVLGTDNVWFARLESICQAYMAYVDTNRAGIPFPHSNLARFHEVNGDMMQVLSRLFHMTGTAQYLDWAVAIADHILLSNGGAYVPTNETYLKLVDHGGEVINGLLEVFYACCADGRTTEIANYQTVLKTMLDRLLAVGRYPGDDADSPYIFYWEINPYAGTVITSTAIDTWGYIYAAYHTYDKAMGVLGEATAYGATLQTVWDSVVSLPQFVNAGHEGSDYYADNLESFVMLSQMDVTVVEEEMFDWYSHVIGSNPNTSEYLFDYQDVTGLVYGRYDDGSFGRGCIWYAEYLAKGVRPDESADDLGIYGAIDGNNLTLTVHSDTGWSGNLLFRSAQDYEATLDYVRLNYDPPWFVVDGAYSISSTNYTAAELASTGVPVSLSADETLTLTVYPCTATAAADHVDLSYAGTAPFLIEREAVSP